MVAMIRRIVILAIGLFGWLSVSCSEDASVHVDPCAEVDSLASAGQYEKAVCVWCETGPSVLYDLLSGFHVLLL